MAERYTNSHVMPSTMDSLATTHSAMIGVLTISPVQYLLTHGQDLVI